MTLASNPLSRHGGNPGVMTNTREATKLAQQLATDLQVTGIQCVEALVEWMLEAGAQAEYVHLMCHLLIFATMLT